MQLDEFESGLVAAMPMLKAFAVKLCCDIVPADDLVQDTMVRALSRRHLFQAGSNLQAWLTVILRNTFINGKRQARSRRRGMGAEIDDSYSQFANSAPDPDCPLSKIEAAEAFALIERLPKCLQRPLVLSGLGASQEEIADDLRIELGTVKSRVCRARAMLREAVQ